MSKLISDNIFQRTLVSASLSLHRTSGAAMETKLSTTLVLARSSSAAAAPEDFDALFTDLHTLLLYRPARPPPIAPLFSSTTISARCPTSSPREARSIFKSLSSFERALIGAAAGGAAGAFTYVCLLPLDAVKTRLQTRGAAQLYSSALDAALHILRTEGIPGFYRGLSAVLFGSATSSAIYFGTCELAKSLFPRLAAFPPLLVPPAAGASGNVVSSAVMVPKELITQRMQAGAKGGSLEVLLRILEKDGILGLYAGYSATLLRNLPTGILSYSSFEYLKAFVLARTKKVHLEPRESVLCGALAGAISASLTTPLDVVKTRLMTRARGEGGRKISETVAQILAEEGPAGLARGIGPRVLHSACFAALGYFAFETAKLLLLQQYVRRREEEAEKLREVAS